mgnify:CR=1 FL=1
MGISLFLLIAIVGFGIVAAVIGVVVVVVVSRRDDFVNPFGGQKSNPNPTQEPASGVSHRPVASFNPADDEKTALVDWLLAQATAQTGLNLSQDPMVRDRIVNAAQNALQTLESQDTAQISLPFLAADAQGPKHFDIQLTRQMLRQLR